MGELDGGGVATERAEFTNASLFAAEIGTTGYRGGDAGHGSRAILIFENLGATSWEVEVSGRHGATHPDRVTLRFGGDAEVANLADALDFVAARLREQLASRSSPSVR